jgi:hypothetical protein
MSNKPDQPDDEYFGVENASKTGVSGYFSRPFVSFKNPTYRLYYFSMVGRWPSMNMQTPARNLLVFRIVDSEAVLGVLAGGKHRYAGIRRRHGDSADRCYTGNAGCYAARA